MENSGSCEPIPAKKIPVAVVGCGYFGARHAAIYAGHPSARLVAIVDPRAEARSIAEIHGATWYRNIEDLPSEVRAVSVAVPAQYNADVGCRLLEREHHVLLEKPMALNLADADRLIGTAKRKGRVLQIGYVERFNPAVAWVNREVRLPPVRLEFLRLGPPSERHSVLDVVLDSMIHDIDLALHWTGEPPSAIRASGPFAGGPITGVVDAEIEFPGGTSVRLTASQVSVERVRKVNIVTERACYTVDLLRGTVRTSGDLHRDLPAIGNVSSVWRREPAKSPLYREIDAFLSAVSLGRASPVSGAEGRAALTVAIEISAQIRSHARSVS
jgi:predicted dehydrogenase